MMSSQSMLTKPCYDAGKGVYLDLSVKVQDKWRDSLQSVQQLGY